MRTKKNAGESMVWIAQLVPLIYQRQILQSYCQTRNARYAAIVTQGVEMKTLFLTPEQARSLADDLREYSLMKDSSERDLYKGFKVTFGDMLASDMQADQSLEMTPIPEFTLIEGEKA